MAAKPTVASLICTLILLLTCGINNLNSNSIIVVTATVASAARASSSTSCVENPNQPKCTPSPGGGESNSGMNSQDTTCESTREDGECASTPPVPKEQSVSDTTDSAAAAAATETTTNGIGSSSSVHYPKFHVGDVIELYNTESQDIQIVFPSLVAFQDPTRGLYHITKTTDGQQVHNIPERFLHPYIPYKIGSEVLCNIGDFKPSRPMIVKCTVLAYNEAKTATASNKGAKVLQNEYLVKVHETKVNKEFETTLPVWKMQRRYRAA
jgi:hypothetical protein